MTQAFFVDQINRLKIRFGAKAFDTELIKLLGKEIALVPEDFFKKTVDTWIGMRKQSSPPLLIDFREARIAYEKGCLVKEANEAVKGFNNGLKEVLQKHYKVDTLKEAFELEALKIRLGEINAEKLRSNKD